MGTPLEARKEQVYKPLTDGDGGIITRQVVKKTDTALHLDKPFTFEGAELSLLVVHQREVDMFKDVTLPVEIEIGVDPSKKLRPNRIVNGATRPEVGDKIGYRGSDPIPVGENRMNINKGDTGIIRAVDKPAPGLIEVHFDLQPDDDTVFLDENEFIVLEKPSVAALPEPDALARAHTIIDELTQANQRLTTTLRTRDDAVTAPRASVYEYAIERDLAPAKLADMDANGWDIVHMEFTCSDGDSKLNAVYRRLKPPEPTQPAKAAATDERMIDGVTVPVFTKSVIGQAFGMPLGV